MSALWWFSSAVALSTNLPGRKPDGLSLTHWRHLARACSESIGLGWAAETGSVVQRSFRPVKPISNFQNAGRTASIGADLGLI